MQPFIPHFIQEQYLLGHFHGSIEGAVLFVDISGFTVMTQQLMDKGQKEGAEILSNILNTIFEVMIKEVYHAQGFITHFAGDAFTAIFPIEEGFTSKDTALAALQCAQTIQDFFQQNGTQYSKFGRFDLQIKIGLSFGKTDWGIVGDKLIMGVEACKFYFRGKAIDEATHSEQQANRGETLLSQDFKSVLNEISLKGDYLDSNIFRFEGFVQDKNVFFPIPHPPNLPHIKPNVLDLFIPNEIVSFREKGEFRNIISIFISFKGIESHKKLNTFASIILKHIIRYKGSLKEIDLGDKGAVLIVFFGAPVAYENNLARALYFAEEVKSEATNSNTLKRLQFRMGITSGKVYAGILGGEYRCEYTCLGNTVNMAARIMMKAKWGEIWVNDSVAAQPSFSFRKKGDFEYKGFGIPISTYEYLGKEKKVGFSSKPTPIIGHENTLTELTQQLSPILEGKFASITYIFGEAGIGKTRLVYALKEKMTSDVKWLHVTADQILPKPFHPFKDVLITHFKFPRITNTAAQKNYFEIAFQSLIIKINYQIALSVSKEASKQNRIHLLKEAKTELLRTKSILAAQVGVHYIEDNLLEQLDAKGKYENTILAIQNFLKTLSLIQPLVIHLEDSQWLDTDSIVLLQRLEINLAEYPIAILSTARYKDNGGSAILPFKDIPQHTIELTYLEPNQVKILAEMRLNIHANQDLIPVSSSLLEVLVERSKGNPFFVEQLLRFFGENQWLQKHSGTWQLTQQINSVPDSIQGLLMARIDRLSKQVKQVVKVAAVVGREFEIPLLSTLLNRNILAETKVAETEQIWSLQREAKGVFKHTLLRDMAYGMQLKAQLRQLHQLTATAMENRYVANIEEKYADIAFHYEKAETTIKAIEYLEKAGDYAKENFQNQQALDFFERLLQQLEKLNDENFIWKILLKKATVQGVIGKWDASKATYLTAMELAKNLKNEAYQNETMFNLARIFSWQGRYQEALDYYQQCLEKYYKSKDKNQIANTIGYMGAVYINLSKNEDAAKCFQQQISLASELGDEKNHATALGNLGSLFNQLGKYDAAMDCYMQSYELFEKINHPQNAAMNLTNMGSVATIRGDYDAAMEYYQESLKHFKKVGYQHGIIYTIVNIGYTFMQQGEYNDALSYYQKSLRLSLEMKDRRLQGFVEGNIGRIYYKKNAFGQALSYLEQAIVGHQQIGFKHSLAEWYWLKALCIYELEDYTQALDWTEQSIQVSKAISRVEMLFKAKLLKAKVQFRRGEETTALSILQNLLENTEKKEERAEIHFELWQAYRYQILQTKKMIKTNIALETPEKAAQKNVLLTIVKKHHQKALQLYQELSAIKPKEEYEPKIALLKLYK